MSRAAKLPDQLRWFGDRLRVELLLDVAVDPDRLDMPKILDRRTEPEPVEQVQSLAVGGGFGRAGRQARQAGEDRCDRGSDQHEEANNQLLDTRFTRRIGGASPGFRPLGPRPLRRPPA